MKTDKEVIEKLIDEITFNMYSDVLKSHFYPRDNVIKIVQKALELKEKQHKEEIDKLFKKSVDGGWEIYNAVQEQTAEKVKRLKEEFMRRFYGSEITTKDYDEFLEFIDKLMGFNEEEKEE